MIQSARRKKTMPRKTKNRMPIPSAISAGKREESRFLAALESLFTGAEVEGESGFVNLMRLKRRHFNAVREHLMAEISACAPTESAFREDLFGKLYTFFSRYFCETGSVYFRHLPAYQRVYERVYADGRDVALAWKTHMLYYVKSDVLVRSIPVELRGQSGATLRFHFDASAIEHKQSNERKDFVFSLAGVAPGEKGPVTQFKVAYSKNGTKTKTEEILKDFRNKHRMGSITEDDLQAAFRVFRRQTEADFFINKNARAFLREQLDLWMHQILLDLDSQFGAERLKQLKDVKRIAYYIIDFIAQFEDELALAWNKPKFARGVNYVVTLNRLPLSLVKKIAAHAGIKAQIAEWRELKLADESLSKAAIFQDGKLNPRYQFLPIDTKHFKSLDAEILAAFDDLDSALDGELVHSENYQALNTLAKKYRGRVKCIYIDPPFNLDKSDQFDYRTNYKDANWATMLENRISLARNFLSDDGAIFVRCDHNGNWIVRCLLDKIFENARFMNEIIVNRTQEFFKSPTPKQKKLMNDIDSLLLCGKSEITRLNRIQILRIEEVWHEPFLPARDNGNEDEDDEEKIPNGNARTIDGKEYFPPHGRKWGLTQETVDKLFQKGRIKVGKAGKIKYWPLFKNIKNNWTDIPGYARSWGFKTENAEELLQRSLVAITNEGKDGEDKEIVLDFFAGSGTTMAVAQKFGRKWLGVEMGEHFDTVILPRMKKVVGGHQSGISKEVDYKGGGFFKYYSLEQYEETLRASTYNDGEYALLDSNKTPFQQYIFFADEKFAHAVKRGGKDKIKINLGDLYPDIDIAESLANVLGRRIRRRDSDTVTFADSEDGKRDSVHKINPAKMSEKEKMDFLKKIKPYLRWGKE